MEYGLHPAVLQDQGLGGALVDLASRLPLELAMQDLDSRFAPDLEAAAWFVVCESVMLLSQTLESRYAAELARMHPIGFGYLLKDRVVDVSVLVDALQRVAAGQTVLDAEVVSFVLGRRSRRDHVAVLSDREREVLGLMAQGRSNAAIGRQLVLTAKTVETHIGSILGKLDLTPEADDHRRVLAVLAWLQQD